MEASTVAKQIAQGQQPAWEKTFEHPKHGSLTFRVKKLPTVADWIAHTNVQEQLTPGGTPSVLSAAVAAMSTFMEVPILDENRIEDPDNPDHFRIEVVRYDPLQDEDFTWVCKVWLDFYAWRETTISDSTQEQVKNSSRATAGDADGGSSLVTTDSPQPTLA
jgi:hypothetical protein